MPAAECQIERRQFLQSAMLGAGMAILGVAPAATATNAPERNAMSNATRIYEPLTSENAALLLIDHQVGLMTGVRDYSTGELKHNVVGLAKAAKALKLPIIVTTTARDSMWGPTFPELVETCPGRSSSGRSRRLAAASYQKVGGTLGPFASSGRPVWRRKPTSTGAQCAAGSMIKRPGTEPQDIRAAPIAVRLALA